MRLWGGGLNDTLNYKTTKQGFFFQNKRDSPTQIHNVSWVDLVEVL